MNYLGYTVAYLDSNGELVDAGQVIDVNMQCDGAYNLNFCYGSFAKVSSDDIIGIEKSSKSDIEKAQLINLEIKRLMNIIKETLSIVDDLSRSKEILGSDLEKILLVLNNISEYLYNKYGEYEKVSKEVFIMLKTLVDPVVMNEGIEKGIKKGIEKGIEKGELKNQQRLALKLLKKKLKDIPSDIEKTINCIDDIDILEKVIDNIFDINSVDQVKEMLKKD